MNRFFLVVALSGAACELAPERAEAPAPETLAQAVSTAHTFDFASKAPDRLSIMYSMAWFGIDSDAAVEPQKPPGQDPNYRNWAAGGTPCAMMTPNAAAADTCILLGQNNVCLEHETNGVPQRKISSRRRPLTGIWSGTGRDDESKRKLDLMLSMVRRPGCRTDDGAKLDVWAIQNNSIKLSSKYLANPGSASDFPYRMMMAMFARANLAGMQNVVLPGLDVTFYFNFSADEGMGKCDDTANNPRSTCMDAIEQDLRDMALASLQNVSGLKVDGKPVLFVYTDSYQPHAPTYAEWTNTILPVARSAANTDFYVIGVNPDPHFFEAFDALAPWLSTSSYNNAAGTSVYTDSFNHTIHRHQSLVAGVGAYPGRLVYGAFTPGFDDWTRDWSGPCEERQVPTDSPRDPALLQAESDFFHGCVTDGGCVSGVEHYAFRGFLGETWDDWTEGSHFEPDVEGGPDRLVRLRGLLGRVFGDPYPDVAGDDRLAARWNSYGQARNGLGGDAGVSPVTDLSCDLDAGTQDAGIHDAGTPTHDAGTSVPDAGNTHDAGVTDRDAGERDAGELDAGEGHDAGEGQDAGEIVDDAGFSDAGAATPVVGHPCGCTSGPGDGLALALLFALSSSARRARNGR
jgi:hypothetical protein